MEISDIYREIGQNILDSISDNWVEAKLNIEYAGSVGFNLEYKNKDREEKSAKFQNAFSASRKIKDLHVITTENEKNKWNRAVFSLKPDGDFDIEFVWDQELQDEVESFK